ncbi:MAG: sulfatase-like hydrolase/transferase [Bryobacterales bacterium]|nr:sulfatase-like hydrolase/transferase [Bryobacterales bacterium]
MLTRRAALGSMLAAGASGASAFQEKRKPNFIVILADDLGYGDIGCYGSPDVPTPHIDSIARNGIRFTDGYVSAAVCSPSRAALLTGRYQHRFGHEFNSGPVEREAQINFGLPKSEKILPSYLKEAGYVSGMFGKWHLGARPGYHPNERGFDEFVGFLPGADDFVTERTPDAHATAADGAAGRIPSKRSAPLLRGQQEISDDRYLTEILGDEAEKFIDGHKADPFFLYLPFNAVHTPLQATTKYLRRFDSIKNEKHRMLAAMTAAMDDAVGRLLAKLKETKLDQDTMVVFLSDNGCPMMTGAGSNGTFSGEKVSYYEGGIRVPFLMQWPGRLPSGQIYKHPVVSRDLLPTLLAAAGMQLTENIEFDGINLLPYLTGRNRSAPHEILFWRCGNARVVRKGQWKLIEFGDQFTRLYNLAADPAEKTDLSPERVSLVNELRASWKNWSSQMAPPAWPPRFREVTVHGQTLNWEL